MRVTQFDAVRKKTIFMIFAICCIVVPMAYSVIQEDIRDHILTLSERIVLTCIIMTPSISWGIVSWRNLGKDWAEEQRKREQHIKWMIDTDREFRSWRTEGE